MSERDPQHTSQDRTQHSDDGGTTDTTFNSAISGEPIPDSPGVKTTPGSGHSTQTGDPTPLSQDVDPIRQFEEPEDFSKSAPLVPGRADSPTSSIESGVDAADLPVEPLNFSASANYRSTITPNDLDEESFALETADLDENLDGPAVEEIPMANLDVESADGDAKLGTTLGEGEMDPANVPGEIDIEALGDGAIDDLLPPDARLDPIEE